MGDRDHHQEEKEDYGYGLFPEHQSEKARKGLLAESLFTFNHKCRVMLQVALDTSPYAKLLIDAMKSSGCAVYRDRHFSCEDCDGTVSGGFDAEISQIRAANLSGECTFGNELLRFNFGLKEHHQKCVRERALRSILAVRKVSKEAAKKAVDEVFDTCFNDLEPFGRIPHNKKDAKYAYKDFQNRNRYYANL
ncbi:mitochondrial inner membrane protease ATP23 homolog isoform X2 [Stegostoma tigrinum]|uniref:mitochondrial inner membrane protease ATP23 homolog isoform X2 n=1 Tax=Stegostoma tigrinum TaxID=3053191 RepID=UPI00202B9AE9|nr:mitochondrial inner membrane protease ATP23 homolog isoform X2 [Stegostoma tigrinum]